MRIHFGKRGKRVSLWRPAASTFPASATSCAGGRFAHGRRRRFARAPSISSSPSSAHRSRVNAYAPNIDQPPFFFRGRDPDWELAAAAVQTGRRLHVTLGVLPMDRTIVLSRRCIMKSVFGRCATGGTTEREVVLRRILKSLARRTSRLLQEFPRTRLRRKTGHGRDCRIHLGFEGFETPTPSGLSAGAILRW